MTEKPIWQSAVRGTCNGERALGRIFIQGDDVYYFPEIPLHRNWLIRSLVPGTLGIFLVLFSVWMAMASPSYGASHIPYDWIQMGLEMAGVGGLLFLLLAGVNFGYEKWSQRVPEGFVEDDEYIGMSLEERFSQSPKAVHFKRADIEELREGKTVTIRTKLGNNLKLQTFPHDDAFVKHLHWGSHDDRLPKEEIGGSAASQSANMDVLASQDT